MRYTVGNNYAFARVKFEGQGFFSPLYVPTRHNFIGIDMVLLRCAEHHKVSDEYRDEASCDGFIFEQVKPEASQRWLNQYPTAHYGQLDDSADRRVRREYPEDAPFTDEHMVFYSDAFHMLAEIYRAFNGSQAHQELLGLTSEMRTGFEIYFQVFKNQLETLIDHKVECRPFQIKKTDGTVAISNSYFETILSEEVKHEEVHA